MKKILLSLILGIGVVSAAQAQQFTYTANILAGTQTNIFTGPFKITSIILNSTNNVQGYFVDDATGTNINYVTLAYTNTTSYLTNYTYTYTNYFGVITTNSGGMPLAGSSFSGTNWALVDVTNNVPQQTNALPSIAVSSGANVPVILNPVNFTVYRGLSFTNANVLNTSRITVTVTGVRF